VGREDDRRPVVAEFENDLPQDLESLRAFYADIEGRWPEKTGPIEFPPQRRPRNRKNKKGSEPVSGTDPNDGKGF